MTVLSDWACTCRTNHVPVSEHDHEDHCALWDCDEWACGKLSWDELAGVLFDPTHGYEETDEAQLEKMIDECYADDDLIECTCTPASLDEPTTHQDQCSLWTYKPWVECECDFDWNTWSLVWRSIDAACSCKPQASYACPKCGVARDSLYSNDWYPLGAVGATDTAPVTPSGKVDNVWEGYGYGYLGSSLTNYNADRHYLQPLKLVDGTTIYASSKHTRKLADPVPDFALYVDSSWYPDCHATYIPWRDHGLPQIPLHVAAGAIVEAYRLAKDGFTVEIGCIGGHGRTGTVLACMAVLTGLDADASMQYIWDNYCKRAIESDDQEWFVKWFHAWAWGNPAPPTPPMKPPPPKIEKPATTGAAKSPYWDKPKSTPMWQRKPCVVCNTMLDESMLHGYLCHNQKCVNYHLTANSPAGKTQLSLVGTAVSGTQVSSPSTSGSRRSKRKTKKNRWKGGG